MPFFITKSYSIALVVPVIVAAITGLNRFSVFLHTVSLATDSIISQKKLDFDSNELGEFKLDNSGNNWYVLQNGFYRFNGSRSNEV